MNKKLLAIVCITASLGNHAYSSDNSKEEIPAPTSSKISHQVVQIVNIKENNNKKVTSISWSESFISVIANLLTKL